MILSLTLCICRVAQSKFVGGLPSRGILRDQPHIFVAKRITQQLLQRSQLAEYLSGFLHLLAFIRLPFRHLSNRRPELISANRGKRFAVVLVVALIFATSYGADWNDGHLIPLDITRNLLQGDRSPLAAPIPHDFVRTGLLGLIHHQNHVSLHVLTEEIEHGFEARRLLLRESRMLDHYKERIQLRGNTSNGSQTITNLGVVHMGVVNPWAVDEGVGLASALHRGALDLRSARPE
mmetsp:Transcript_123443/g.283004  ORF Transcript_123443/g.283004 Transcript_123443/m.283004 type:complete len:235 (-) Transcript_123443:152-856(-)